MRTLRLDADTASKKGATEDILHKFAAGKADVLIGTQMIAKGHHFPAVTLVGVLYLDSALLIPDFRAQENAFQLMTQVAGRAGRADLPGEVILQTLMPHHPLVQSIQRQDYQSFYNEEIVSRKNYFYPPFSRVVKCLFSGENAKETELFGLKVHAFLQNKLPSTFFLHRVGAAGYAKIRNCYRFQFFVRGSDTKTVTELLSIFLHEQKVPASLTFLIDVQPLSLF